MHVLPLRGVPPVLPAAVLPRLKLHPEKVHVLPLSNVRFLWRAPLLVASTAVRVQERQAVQVLPLRSVCVAGVRTEEVRLCLHARRL